MWFVLASIALNTHHLHEHFLGVLQTLEEGRILDL